MGLETIYIKNYKCIRNFKIKLKDMNLLLGENGSGKTNVLSAITYFYNNMISQKISQHIFDENNILNDQVEITLTYDLTKLLIRSRKNRKEEKVKYQNYYSMIEKMSQNNKVSLTLTQAKGGRIFWNHDIEERKVLYHLYPLYALDAREINLVDWENLWKNIGDLLKPSSSERDVLHQEITNALEVNSSQLENRLKLLNAEFNRLQIKPIRFSVSEFAANMAKIYYEGQAFSYIGHRLDSFSNGTNSFNYMSLMLYVLSAMGRSKMKEPLLLMDEPEISLHFQMIDELAEELFVCIEDITVLAATHSPRFVKNVLVKERENSTIYQVYKRGDYSHLCLLNMFSKEEKREKYFLTEHHANAFFSKMLILVEGETELELLQNSYLRCLFPILKSAEVIKGMSNKVIYRIIDTTTRNYNVPMATLLDMDKILSYDIKSYHVEWKKKYPFEVKKEKYLYGKKRINTISLGAKIDNMCSKCTFWYRFPLYASKDPYYDELIRLVKEYYENYSVFPVKTTIEGALINENNYLKVIDFLKKTNRWQHYKRAYQKLFDVNDKVNFLRLIFNGKTDLLLKAKNVVEENKKLQQEIKKVLEGKLITKTDWVSEWLQYYFADFIGIPQEIMSEKIFREWLEQSNNRSDMRKRFALEFSELNQFLELVSKVYRASVE